MQREAFCLGKIWYQVRRRVLTGRHFRATNLVSLWQRQLPAQQQDNYIQVQGFDSTNSRWIFPACSGPPQPPHPSSTTPTPTSTTTTPHSSPRCLSSGPAWNRCPWRKKKKKENTTALTCDWGPWQKAEALPENLKVMNHVVYYNNWNGSKWKHSPEYSRR